MSDSRTRLQFKVGELFPTNDPVAVFIVSMSLAITDMMITSKLLVGGDDQGPGNVEGNKESYLFSLRLCIVQLDGFLQTFRHGIQNRTVAEFVSRLPEQARRDCDALRNFGENDDRWIKDAVTFLRNQAVHFGDRKSQVVIISAMELVAEMESCIESSNGKLAGIHLNFTDDIVAQHFVKHIPKPHGGHEASDDSNEVNAQLETLFQHVVDVFNSGINFALTAIDLYLENHETIISRINF